MEPQEPETIVRDIMKRFASETGLHGSSANPRRYLWTDAFAVCNWLQLYCQSNEVQHLQSALALINQVHETLGRHRNDDRREGWISGFSEEEGRLHPTSGGLRIGKRLDERKPGEPYEDRLEWDRDGQYYHYLTKWMHALCQTADVTGDLLYSQWACELAKTTHRAFVHQPRQVVPKQLYWKMSIDLSHPQVLSMGHHDPLDGLITFHEVDRVCAERTPCNLNAEIAELADMCLQQNWVTSDPLGLGGLLFDAYRMLQLIADVPNSSSTELILEVLQSVCVGLDYFFAQNDLDGQPGRRLAFRELGLSIGLHAVPKMRTLMEESPQFDHNDKVSAHLDRLVAASPIANSIELFWLNESNKETASWHAYKDINKVMLATSLAPDGFLNLRLEPRGRYKGASRWRD